MSGAIFLRALLLLGSMSFLVIGGNDFFKKYKSKGSVLTLEYLQPTNFPCIEPNIKGGALDGATTCLKSPTRIKRGGRAALVDLLDYMNKPKAKAQGFASTLTSQGTPLKHGFWEAMLYDEK